MKFADYLQLTQDDCLMHAWSKRTGEEYLVNSSFQPPHPINPIGAMQRVSGPSDDLENTIGKAFPEFEVGEVKANAFLATSQTGRGYAPFSSKDHKIAEMVSKTNLITFIQFYFIPEEYLFVQSDIGVREPPRTRAQLRKESY